MIKTILSSEITWIDITAPTDQELQDVAQQFNLHTTSLEDCLDPRHQPKYERVGKNIFIIVRAYDRCCDTKTDSILKLTRKLAIFSGEGYLITIHKREMAMLEELELIWLEREDITKEDQCVLLLDLLKAVVYSFAPALEQLEGSLEEFEESLFANDDTPVIIKEIHWFRSRVSAIRRIFRQSYEVILKINDDYIKNHDPLHQDVRERLERYISLTDALREASNDILNTHISLASHRTNEVIRVLTIFSVFFLPLTFIVGVYGMNFDHMPELRWIHGYPVSWAVMLLITTGIFFWFKRRGWLK